MHLYIFTESETRCLSVRFCDSLRSALSKAGLAPAAVSLPYSKCWDLRKKLYLALPCLTVGTFTAHSK